MILAHSGTFIAYSSYTLQSYRFYSYRLKLFVIIKYAVRWFRFTRIRQSILTYATSLSLHQPICSMKERLCLWWIQQETSDPFGGFAPCVYSASIWLFSFVCHGRLFPFRAFSFLHCQLSYVLSILQYSPHINASALDCDDQPGVTNWGINKGSKIINGISHGPILSAVGLQHTATLLSLFVLFHSARRTPAERTLTYLICKCIPCRDHRLCLLAIC